MLYIENNECSFHTTEFKSEDEIKELLNSFIKGKYAYNMEFKKLNKLVWQSNSLSSFDRGEIDKTLELSKMGFDWTKKN